MASSQFQWSHRSSGGGGGGHFTTTNLGGYEEFSLRKAQGERERESRWLMQINSDEGKGKAEELATLTQSVTQSVSVS